VQIDAYQRGVAAILEKIGAAAKMCCGHKEYALPSGRKTDPTFQMDPFRTRVAAILAGAAPPLLIPATDGTDRGTLRRGATGEMVKNVQAKLQLAPADGIFGSHTEAAVREFQRKQGLVADGIIGPKSWTALDNLPP
jgi:peptidoglycan hydrolase-like protein with peptidoglycan-binding domain